VFTGSYDPKLQLLVGEAGTARRIVTGFRLDDGRLVAVVRGVTDRADPPPPAGTLRQTGVLLPSEDSGDPGTSLRVPLLAQTWPDQLVEGYVNLTAAESVAQGIQPSPLNLPAAPGRLRNGAYALQWWLFAIFALVLAVRIARDLDRGRDLELAAEADAHANGEAQEEVDGATADRQKSEESSTTT
jgi:cytochrome oxidase assembly protein ShyY1